MLSFEKLQQAEVVFLDGENSIGLQYVRRGNPGTIQCFEHAGVELLPSFVSLHEAAHLWVHNDFEHDAWYVLDVDEPLEVGTDYVILHRREGNSIRQFEASDDPAPTPPRLAELRALIPKLQAAARSPTDVWIANLVAKRVMAADSNTIFVVRENRFYVQDLAPTPEELREWRRISEA